MANLGSATSAVNSKLTVGLTSYTDDRRGPLLNIWNAAGEDVTIDFREARTLRQELNNLFDGDDHDVKCVVVKDHDGVTIFGSNTSSECVYVDRSDIKYLINLLISAICDNGGAQ